MNNKCPCINCICVPMCKHKFFSELKTQCSLVYDYLTYDRKSLIDMYTDRVNKIYKVLKPTTWQGFSQ